MILDDKYQLENLIGQGGMGRVYRATHIHIGTPIAIKVLRSDLVADPTSVERFRREARAAAQIRHPNAVLVTDFGVERGSGMVYLVMEFLEGISLKEKLEREKRLSPYDVLLILSQVCLALNVAHSKGIVHRDIKPDNIFLAHSDIEDSTVKVLDFGLAKLKKNIHEDATTITQAGMILGTPCYMSPEQCMAENQDARSDIYSLGVMTYQMLTGILPFRGPGFSKILMQHCSEAPPSLCRLVPDIPTSVETVVLRSLAKDPLQRQQSVVEFFEQLQAAYSQVGITPVPTNWERSSGERSRSTLIDSSPKANQPSNTPQKMSLAGTPTGAAPLQVQVDSKSDSLESMPTGPISLQFAPTVVPTDTPKRIRDSQKTALLPPPLTSSDKQTTPETVLVTEKKPNSRMKVAVIIATVVIVLGGGIGLIFSLVQHGFLPAEATKTSQPMPQPPLGMVFVPGGKLMMGNNESQDAAEKPEHEVQIKPFFLDKFEVTNEDFMKFVQAKKYPAPSHWKNAQIPPGEDKFPVTNVSWEDAQAYALWAGKRLPTEEEWEWAAHGEHRQAYPWGNEFSANSANTKESRKNALMPVGSFPSGVSLCGAFDLIGNAAEWTTSDYVPYPGSQAKPEPGQKIIRGGGFQTDQKKATSTKRFIDLPGTRNITLGFRCAADLSISKPE